MKLYSPVQEDKYIEVEFTKEEATELVLIKYNNEAKRIKESMGKGSDN